MDPKLVKKLLLKPGYQVLVMNAPEGYLERLTPLPEGSEMVPEAAATADLVQLFVHREADIATLAPQALAAVKPGGLLWLCYPKRGQKLQTDINRDHGWEPVNSMGWAPVTQIAIDDTWSALRFRPEADIRRTERRTGEEPELQ